jgi:hypothetical protein
MPDDGRVHRPDWLAGEKSRLGNIWSRGFPPRAHAGRRRGRRGGRQWPPSRAPGGCRRRYRRSGSRLRPLGRPRRPRGYGRAWGRRPRRMRDRRGPCAVRPSTAGSVPAAGTTWPASRFPRPGRVAGTGAYQNTLFRRARSPLRPVALPGCSMGFGGVVGPCAPWWQRTSALSRRCTSAIFSADIGPAQITRLRRTQ